MRLENIPYFLKISPRRDLISSRCTLRRNWGGGGGGGGGACEISRAATSPLARLAPAHSSISIVRLARVRLHSAYFE